MLRRIICQVSEANIFEKLIHRQEIRDLRDNF